ncbi:Spectrin beta chain, non-erythrocytic 1, partial [Cichlidogyrus casuarinus]
MEVQALHQNLQFNPGNLPAHQAYISDDDDFESGNSTAKLYERSRIKALADEREYVQKKTFTKWINCHLDVLKFSIEDMYLDLRDGRMLLKLLEVLSGERLPKPTKGKMRIHCLENVDKALSFLSDQHVHLENVGAHDIVDGNSRLTLGLIWTIILRFQIQDIIMEDYQTTEVRNVKDTLLLWCQMKTAGYNNVNIRNFSTSWRDGLAFNALIHKHRPDLVDYSKLVKAKHVDNLNAAFDVADNKLKISKLLDPKDIDVEQPDEKSVMTYVATLYAYFNSQKAQSVQAKRVDKVMRQAIDIRDHVRNYEDMTTDLLRWIEQTIVLLSEREYANSLSGVMKQLAEFNSYRQ